MKQILMGKSFINETKGSTTDVDNEKVMVTSTQKRVVKSEIEK